MNPGSFDIETCRKVVGDERVRVIESMARELADQGLPLPPDKPQVATYWGQSKEWMERIIAVHTHHHRIERLARKKQQEHVSAKDNQSNRRAA